MNFFLFNNNRYYRGAEGILLMFDLTNRQSFGNIQNWFRSIEEHSNANCEIILIGNKYDLKDKRVVTYEEANGLAAQYNCDYFETSALTGKNVVETYETLTRLIVQKKFRNSNDDNSNVNNVNNQDNGNISLKVQKTKQSFTCCN
eukprot:TRINITY_DN250_c0_g2_i2.p1 TRINITY_DN250_c0_g2~~TRINITY_DN250_c0_g2_i2.p1  ORF type:complete len:145 (-),score=28.59 TRINITY_DN250_c0_g2_i2:79-513(-)